MAGACTVRLCLRGGFRKVRLPKAFFQNSMMCFLSLLFRFVCYFNFFIFCPQRPLQGAVEGVLPSACRGSYQVVVEVATLTRPW